MAKLPTITVSEVLKKDLKLVGFLIVNGLVVYISETYLKNNVELSIIFGGAANYILYRLTQELTDQGYRQALK